MKSKFAACIEYKTNLFCFHCDEVPFLYEKRSFVHFVPRKNLYVLEIMTVVIATRESLSLGVEITSPVFCDRRCFQVSTAFLQ